VRTAIPEFSEAHAREIERQIRTDWGGERPYIGKDMKRKKHERQRIKDKLRKHNIDEVSRSDGVSRRTLYRLLKEKNEDD